MKVLYSIATIGLLSILIVSASSDTGVVQAQSIGAFDYSCQNAEIAAWRAMANATVQSQADLAESHARAYEKLYQLQQNC